MPLTVMLWPIHLLTANCGKVIAISFSHDERSVCQRRSQGSTPAAAQMRRTCRMIAPLPPIATIGMSPSGIASKRSWSNVISFGMMGTTRWAWPSYRSVFGL
ncbi:MAG: hypothetical protein KIT88_10520 [Phycisphaeraceae bacterium]|nr:hypothetical protein [Phycisphaeraceae bacterium]